MNALTITHHIAAPLEVLPAELGNEAKKLAIAAEALTVCDVATFEAGNAILLKSHQAIKDIEAARTKLKRPITDLGRSIDAICASVADPLELAKRSLQGKVSAYHQKAQAEADRLRREAAERERVEREAAEKERARLQAEADAKHAAEVAAAKAKAEAEAKELAEVLGTAVEAKPVAVAPAPVIEVAKPATPAPLIPEVPKAATIVKKVQRVQFNDRMAVPVQLAGTILRPIDEAAVKRLLVAGIAVPGAELVEVDALSMRSA